MDKLKKIKHEHKLTDLLKFIIFSLIMLAPFFSIGGRMAYTIFNKNAKDSYSDTLITNQIQITNNSQYQLGAINQINYFEGENNSVYSQYFFFNEISLDLQGVFENRYDTNMNYDQIMIASTGFIYIKDSSISTSQIYIQKWGTIITHFSFTLKQIPTDTFNLGGGNAYIYQYQYKNQTLDNAFDYSISKIADEPVFNWVKDTAIYDGINAMFTGLEYDTDNNPIAIMCAYWLLNTAVYIVIDIVVWAFTKMTHMFVQE